MSKENEEVNLNITGEQIIDKLTDGTEILRDEVDQEEEISDENLRKLVAFTTGEKDISDENLEKLRKDEPELERLIRVSMAKAKHMNYAPKKKFNMSYRQERKRKNKATKQSRINNR